MATATNSDKSHFFPLMHFQPSLEGLGTRIYEAIKKIFHLLLRVFAFVLFSVSTTGFYAAIINKDNSAKWNFGRLFVITAVFWGIFEFLYSLRPSKRFSEKTSPSIPATSAASGAPPSLATNTQLPLQQTSRSAHSSIGLGSKPLAPNTVFGATMGRLSEEWKKRQSAMEQRWGELNKKREEHSDKEEALLTTFSEKLKTIFLEIEPDELARLKKMVEATKKVSEALEALYLEYFPEDSLSSESDSDDESVSRPATPDYFFMKEKTYKDAREIFSDMMKSVSLLGIKEQDMNKIVQAICMFIKAMSEQNIEKMIQAGILEEDKTEE